MLQEENFEITKTDEEILETFAVWKKESQSYHDEMLRDQRIAEKYYQGDQTGKNNIPAYSSNTVENRVYEAIETLVPITTAAAHKFIVMPGSENEMSMKKAEKVQKVLTNKYRTLGMQQKLERVTREMLLYKFGVMEWFWDKEIDNINVRTIDPRLILIPKLRLDPHDLPYKIKVLEFTRDEYALEFPKTKVKVEDLPTSEKVDTGNNDEKKKTIKIFEVWTPEMVAWIGGGQIIDKKPNPYYDFGGEEVTKFSEEGTKKKKELIFRNHLDRPTDPFVFFSTFNVGDGPVAEKGLVDQVIPLQDAINTQKRRIIDNLRLMGNGQVYVDSDAMTQEESENITNEPGAIIRGAGVSSEGKIRREPGVPLPAAHFSNLQHTEQKFDDLMGVHASTRGDSGAPTLGQDIISRQQDFTRIDLITRVLNRGVERIANGLVQLMRMYYTDIQLIKILGEEETIEFLRFNQDDVEDFIEIDVKSGQQLPMDDVSIRTEAIQLWQLGAISPQDLFKRLKEHEPEKMAARLIAWKQGQLDSETVAKIQEAQAGAQAKASADTQRGVETPANSLQRAKANVGGTAPTTKGTPKTSNS